MVEDTCMVVEDTCMVVGFVVCKGTDSWCQGGAADVGLSVVQC